jgi:hypothetical protein
MRIGDSNLDTLQYLHSTEQVMTTHTNLTHAMYHLS